MDKVVVCLGHYLPGVRVGGPLSSIRNIIEWLSGSLRFEVITTNCDFGDKTPYENIPTCVWTKIGNTPVYYVDSAKKRYPQVWNAVRTLSADVFYLNPLLDPIFSSSLVLHKRMGHISSEMIVAPRGELFDEALAFKPLKKKMFLSFARTIGMYRGIRFHATSEFEKECIIQRMKVDPDQVKVARIISRVPDGSFASRSIPFASNLKHLRVVFLARISKDKNLSFVFDVLEIIPSDCTIEFDIFGPIEDQQLWDQCCRRVATLPAHIKVTYHGTLGRNKVRETLSEYDLFFMPTFAENYGHSIAEALSVGTPVLISDKTPWISLASKNLGWDLPLNDVQKFRDAILFISNKPTEQRRADRVNRRQLAIEMLNDPLIVEENLNLFRF